MAQCKWPSEESRFPDDRNRQPKCTHEAHTGHEYCIFHIPLKVKNQDQELRETFKNSFDSLYGAGRRHCFGFEFPDGFEYPVQNISKEMGPPNLLTPNIQHDYASFKWAVFGNGASFSRVDFGGNVSFENALFLGVSSFRNTIFRGQVSYSWSRFTGHAAFEEAQFLHDAEFTNAVFKQGVFFDRCLFNTEAWLVNTRFQGYTSFLRTMFGGIARFDSAQFNTKCSFLSTTFTDGVHFYQTRFNGEVSFHSIKFLEKALQGLTNDLQGRNPLQTQLYQLGSPRFIFTKTEFNSTSSLEGLDLSRTQFQRVDMKNVSFRNCQIAGTIFMSCSWGTGFENKKYTKHVSDKRPFTNKLCTLLRFRRPRLLHDELLWRKSLLERSAPPEEKTELEKMTEKFVTPDIITPAEVGSIAFQLKQSLEATRDPIAAGDFHFAVMEMKREQAREQGRWTRAFVLWLYKMINGYGERYGRTALWIVLLVAASAGLYSGLDGLEYVKDAIPNGGKATDIATLDYISYALQNVLPFKFGAPILKATQPWVRLLCFAETFLGTALFAFFALALRRRFKR